LSKKTVLLKKVGFGKGKSRNLLSIFSGAIHEVLISELQRVRGTFGLGRLVLLKLSPSPYFFRPSTFFIHIIKYEQNRLRFAEASIEQARRSGAGDVNFTFEK